MSKSLSFTNATCIGLNNTALWKDQDGVMHSECVICHKYLGNEFTMDVYSMIRKKYCDSCAKEVRRKQKAESQKKARRNKRLLKQQQTRLAAENEKLRELNALLDERIASLEHRIEELKCD